MLRHLDDADAAAETPIVHAAVQLPAVLLRVEHFDRLQICRPVEPADRHKLSVHYRQPHLVDRNRKRCEKRFCSTQENTIHHDTIMEVSDRRGIKFKIEDFLRPLRPYGQRLC